MEKTKVFLSVIILLFFTILGGGSFDERDFWILFYSVIIVALIVIFIIIPGVKKGQKLEEQKAEEERQKEEEQQLKKAEEYIKQWKVIEDTYGMPNKSIMIEPNDINEEIDVFEEKKKVFIMGNMYDFADIISCYLTDDPITYKGKITSVTKTKDGDAIARALIGKTVGGTAGAIIGGATAKKQTEYYQEDDRVDHDYTVVINVNDITNPIIRINTEWDGEKAEEIVALMNVIILRK